MTSADDTLRPGAAKPDAASAAGGLSESKRRLLDLYLQRGSAAATRAESIAPRAATEPAPLAFEQELIWIHSKLAPELPLYNEILTVRRRGPLDVGALEKALGEIVRRHEAWRTTFESAGSGAVQVVHPPFAFSLPVCDLTTLADAEREHEAARIAVAESRHPIDLSRGPLVRAKLVRVHHDEHRLYVILHQIIHDGVSVYSVFLPELVALYEAFATGKASPLPPIETQYADYAAWQRRSSGDGAPPASLAYWRRQLEGAPGKIDLPTDGARPLVQTFRGSQKTFAVPPGVVAAIKRLSQAEGVTLFVSLLSAFQVLLHRYTAQDDIVVGTAISTRRRPEVEKLLGVFLNTIVVRTQLTESLTFRQLLPRVRQATVDGLSHGDVPFHVLVRELQPKRDPGYNPFFQVTFVLEPPMPPPAAGWDMTQMDADTGVSRVDLYLQMDDRPDGMVGHVRYNADLFASPTIGRLVDHFLGLLESIAADPDVPLAAIPMLAPSERLLVGRDEREPRPSNAFERFEADAIEQSIARRFAAQVAKHGARPAVLDGGATLSYADLDAAANRVAHALRDAGAAGVNRVALLLDHDAPMVAALLGVLKTGGAYVPLDPTHPEERLRRILVDAEPAAVITTRKNRRLADEVVAFGIPLLDVDDLIQGPPMSAYDDRGAATADRLAYLLYTSGSTGQPKGVAQSQRNVLHFIAAYTNQLHLSAEDRLSIVASYGVDAAVMDIFGALLNGAALCPIDVRQVGLGGLRERLVSDRVTVYHSTPTLFRSLAHELVGHPAPAAVRLVVLGGEEVRGEDVALWRERFADSCILVNGLGPTESTIALQYFVDRRTAAAASSPARSGRRSVPVGRPVERTTVALLSRSGRPGQVFGEIGIRSPHVALGYWKNPELTAAAFRSDPAGEPTRIYRTGDLGRLLPDGNIEFRGRRDLQTKIHGFRIELGEVEAALAEHPRVETAAATVFEAPDGDKRLAGYFVASPGPPPTHEDLRRFLRRRLPVHMMPTALVQLDALPLTTSGKVDRRSLPVPEVTSASRDEGEPADALERELVALWKEVLGVPHVGVHDDFFDLGGHSLLALVVMTELEKRTGVNLELATLLECPTVERLADFVRLRSSASHKDPAASPPKAFVRAFLERLETKIRGRRRD
jgi:amino acid adenylation domain-containing protein